MTEIRIRGHPSTIGYGQGTRELDPDAEQRPARARLTELLAETPDDDAMPSSFTPFIDIAVSRGPLR
ncbi:MAG: hypothetical protein ACK5CS_21100, partial [Bradyrhizobium sp.]